MSDDSSNENDTVSDSIENIVVSLIFDGPISTFKKLGEEFDRKKIIKEEVYDEILSKEAIKECAKNEAGNVKRDDGFEYTDISDFELNSKPF